VEEVKSDVKGMEKYALNALKSLTKTIPTWKKRLKKFKKPSHTQETNTIQQEVKQEVPESSNIREYVGGATPDLFKSLGINEESYREIEKKVKTHHRVVIISFPQEQQLVVQTPQGEVLLSNEISNVAPSSPPLRHSQQEINFNYFDDSPMSKTYSFEKRKPTITMNRTVTISQSRSGKTSPPTQPKTSTIQTNSTSLRSTFPSDKDKVDNNHVDEEIPRTGSFTYTKENWQEESFNLPVIPKNRPLPPVPNDSN